MAELIGFVGLGRMGQPMARNLVTAGYTVRAWNRSGGKIPQGAQEAKSPREAAAGARIVITMLADDAAVQAVVLGEDGLLAGLREGGIHLSMSTISVALSERLAEAHRAAGQQYVAAPVFGRPEAADKKQLWIVPGGDDAAIAECMPIFAALGQGTFPMGLAKQASLTKLIGNFMLIATIEALAESLALGEKGGIDPAKLVDLFAGTLFSSPVVKGYGPRIAATSFEPPGFTLTLGFKDASLALKAAEELRVPMPLGSLARDHLLSAIAQGRGGWDLAALATVVREAAGLPPKR